MSTPIESPLTPSILLMEDGFSEWLRANETKIDPDERWWSFKWELHDYAARFATQHERAAARYAHYNGFMSGVQWCQEEDRKRVWQNAKDQPTEPAI